MSVAAHDDMQAQCYEIAGMRVLDCRQDGGTLQSDLDARDRIGDALGHQAAAVAVSADQCGDLFFDLSTRIAGEIVQKFVNYKLTLVIVGDIQLWLASSQSLRDFVRECNQGQQVWFLSTMEEAGIRLEALR